MSKDFFKMTAEERDAEAKKWEGGILFEDTRPLSDRSNFLWDLVKLGGVRPEEPTERGDE